MAERRVPKRFAAIQRPMQIGFRMSPGIKMVSLKLEGRSGRTAVAGFARGIEVAAFLSVASVILAVAFAAYGFMPAETLRDAFNAIFGEAWRVNYLDSRHDAMSERLWITSGVMVLTSSAIWRSRDGVNSLAAQFVGDGLCLWRAAGASARHAFFGGGPSTRVNLLVLVVVGGALRIWFLEAPMSYDEGSAFYTAKQPLLLALTNQWALHQPMAIWGVKLTTWIFGDAAWAVRLSMLMAGLALILITFWAAVIWSNHAVAAFAGAGVAVAWPLVAYSVSARGYAFAAVLFVLLFALTPYLTRTANMAAAAAFAVAMALSVYSLQTMVFPCAGLVGFLGCMILMDRTRPFTQRFRTALRTCCIVGVGGAAFTLVLLSPFLVAHGISGLTTSQSLLGGNQALPFLTFFSSQASAIIGTWIVDLPVPVQLFLGYGFFVGLAVARWTGVLVAALILSVIPIYFIVGELAPAPRIWQYLVPAVLLVAATGLARTLSLLVPGRAVAPSVTVMICVVTVWTSINAFRSEAVISNFAGRAPPWAYEAAEAVTVVVAPGDVIILGSVLDNPGVRYEADRRLARRSLRLALFPNTRDWSGSIFRVCLESARCPRTPPSNAYVVIQPHDASVDKFIASAGFDDVPESDKTIVLETNRYLVQKISGVNRVESRSR